MRRYLYLAYQGTSATVHEHGSDGEAINAWQDWALSESSSDATLMWLPTDTGEATILATCADGEVSDTSDWGESTEG